MKISSPKKRLMIIGIFRRVFTREKRVRLRDDHFEINTSIMSCQIPAIRRMLVGMTSPFNVFALSPFPQSAQHEFMKFSPLHFTPALNAQYQRARRIYHELPFPLLGIPLPKIEYLRSYLI